MCKSVLSAALLLGGLAGVASAGLSPNAQFTLVPASSTLTITGTVGGQTLTQQTPGSTTTRYSGTINASIQGNQVSLFNGALDAAPQAVNQQPAAQGIAGSAQADYGFAVSVPFFGTGNIAARNVLLDVNSTGSLLLTGTTLAGTTNFTFTNADIDYSVIATVGRDELDGLTGPNLSTIPATLVTVGNVQTLTIPVITNYQTSLVTTNDTSLTATGTIVATRVVPEPTLLGTLGAGGLLLARRRR